MLYIYISENAVQKKNKPKIFFEKLDKCKFQYTMYAVPQPLSIK